MSRRLDKDLARWESGELTIDQVASRHPDADLAALTALHTQLARLEPPTPDVAGAWDVVAARLPTAVAQPVRARRLRRPVVAAILASVLAVPAVSYAAAPDAVRSTLRRIEDLLPGVDDRTSPSDGADDPPATTRTAPDPDGAGDRAPSAGTGGDERSDDVDDGGSPAIDDDTRADDGAPDDAPEDRTVEVSSDHDAEHSDDTTDTTTVTTASTEPDGAEAPDTGD